MQKLYFVIKRSNILKRKVSSFWHYPSNAVSGSDAMMSGGTHKLPAPATIMRVRDRLWDAFFQNTARLRANLCGIELSVLFT